MSHRNKFKIVVLFLPLLLLLSGCSDDGSSSSSFEMKQTGQLKSYDENAQEVTDSTLKDDAYYKKGLDSNYTVESEMVRDEVKGLVWQNSAEVGTVTKTWLSEANYIFCDENTNTLSCDDTSGDTALSYCFDLVLGGYSDWRLPTLEELDTLVNYGKHAPAIDGRYFDLNDSNNSFWSASTYESGVYSTRNKAWSLSFVDGSDRYDFKNRALNVRCVRGGK